MKLAAAARYFDRLPVYDAYTGKQLFKAQFDLFDDSKRDAVNIQRRTLSMAPGQSLPARMVVKAGDMFWVVGRTAHNDSFMSGLIRSKYTLHVAQGLATVRTPGQVILATGGGTAYAGLSWTKDWKEAEYTSRVYPYYEAYFGTGETVEAGQYLELDGKILRIRSVYVSEAGFKVAESDELGAARVTVSYKGPGTYIPASDTYTGATATLTALLVPYAADFNREQASAQKREAGDLVILILKAAVPTPNMNDEVTIGGRLYRVISKESESDCWNLVVRP